MTKLLQQCFLFFIVVVIPGHNLVNSQVSINMTIGPTLVLFILYDIRDISFSIFGILFSIYDISQDNWPKFAFNVN